jgi:hypothetical protein
MSTELVSISSTGEQGNEESHMPCISADGRFVAFSSFASNFVPGDTNAVPWDRWSGSDVFVRDRLTGTIECVSVSSAGEQGNGPSGWDNVAISADGGFVAFSAHASNLVPGDTNGTPGDLFSGSDVFVRDRLARTTERVSVSSTGEQGNGNSGLGSVGISADGGFVAFWSYADNLVPGDTNGLADVFVRDRLAGTTERVSVSSAGEEGDGPSGGDNVAISADGRLVAFGSLAGNLVPGDTNGLADVFVRDRLRGTTERVSVSSASEQANGGSGWPSVSISSDGRFVAFWSYADNLVTGDTNYCADLFVRDLVAATTERVNVSSTGQQADRDVNEEAGWPFFPAISADGRFVAFPCLATNLVAGDTNDGPDIFVRDRQTGTTERVSVSNGGEQGNYGALDVSMSADGRFVAFSSWGTNLVVGDTNGYMDVFVHDRQGTPQLEMVINGRAGCTNSTQATLSLGCGNCTHVRFRDDPGAWGPWEPYAATKAWTLPSGDGWKRVCVQGRDAQSNPCGEACDEILLDTVAPSDVSIVANGMASCEGLDWVMLTLAATGATEMRFRKNEEPWRSWEPFATTTWWYLYWAAASETVSFQCRDACGNESAAVSTQVRRTLFDDVPCGHSARTYIEAVVRRGIVSGCSTTPPLYCPYGTITRAEIAMVLCKAAGKTWLDKATPTFADVPRDHPSYGWIERLADAESWHWVKVTHGCRMEGTQRFFCPDGIVHRAQMAKFLCLATRQPLWPTCIGIFVDVQPGDPYCPFIERLVWPHAWPGDVLVTRGCKGSGQNLWYCPYMPLTRGQMAVFLVRAFGIPM